MNEYRVVTDMTADMPHDLVDKKDYDVISMPFVLNGVEYNRDNAMPHKEYYTILATGAQPVTSQIYLGDALDIFEKNLKKGLDVIYLPFSSGMSGTYDVAMQARAELLPKYPDRKILVVDTLSGSGGLGIIVYHALKMQKEGKSMEDIEKWVIENKQCVQHYFVVQDLAYLAKGGRLSKFEASIGSMLNIKPILSLSNVGKIAAVVKAIGMKKVIKEFGNLLDQHFCPDKNDFILFTHGDAEDQLKPLVDLVKTKLPNVKTSISDLSYLIGGHAGKGAIAMFFITKTPARKKSII